MPLAPKPRLILVKRYARSRLYDTTHNRYVSVAELRGWLAKREAFCVVDAEDGADITRVLLA
jgi:polyhydroxyalkanoate synthesis regulator protein